MQTSCFRKAPNTGVKAFETALVALEIETMTIASPGLDSIKGPVISLCVIKKGKELPRSKGGLSPGCTAPGNWAKFKKKQSFHQENISTIKKTLF